MRMINGVGVAVALGLVAAGCGNGHDAGGGSATPPAAAASRTPATTPPAAAVPEVDAKKVKLGTVVVDAKGMTLYMFEKDKGGKSSCYDACAAAWPPLLTTGAPMAGAGIKSSLLGTTTRTDGKTQVTYNKWPLYYFVKDTKPGETTGQNLDDFGAEWYVLSAMKGTKLE